MGRIQRFLRFLAKHRFLFYLLQLTWGLPVNLIGALVFLATLPFAASHKRFHHCFYSHIGHNWGGFSLGLFIFVDREPSMPTLRHESGHTLQVSLMGVFYLFLVAIPSAVRYWYREYLANAKRIPYGELAPYDAVWFERQATEWGSLYEETKEDQE